MNDEDPSELLRRFQSGDAEALAALLERQMGWLHGYVRQRLGAHLRGKDESIDFVQEAVIDLLAKDDTVRIEDEGGLRALLATIVDNDLKDRNKWLRREKRDPDREERNASDTDLGEAWRTVTSPSSAAQRRETEAWMNRALEALSPDDRTVIHLHEWEQLSHQEIGERLGISTDAARVRFQRALPKLALKVAELRRES